MTASSTQRTMNGYLRENYGIHAELASDIPNSHCRSAVAKMTGDDVVIVSFRFEADMQCLPTCKVLEHFMDEKERGGSHHFILSTSTYGELIRFFSPFLHGSSVPGAVIPSDSSVPHDDSLDPSDSESDSSVPGAVIPPASTPQDLSDLMRLVRLESTGGDVTRDP